MDFKKCYEDGYKNHMNELSETDKAWLFGFENAYNEIEAFAANADVFEDTEMSPTLAKVKQEIRYEVLNNLREWLRLSWYECVISMLDETEADVKKENDLYRNPEPLSDKDLFEDEEE